MQLINFIKIVKFVIFFITLKKIIMKIKINYKRNKFFSLKKNLNSSTNLKKKAEFENINQRIQN